MTFTPRPYQQTALEEIEGCYRRGIKSALLVLPTGTGKTAVFSWLIQRRHRAGDHRPTLVIAHREELLTQARDRIRQIAPELRVDLERAERKASMGAAVVVASVQTIGRPNSRRLGWMEPNDAVLKWGESPTIWNYPGLIIVDEAHHVAAAGYQCVLERFAGPETQVLGCTATPKRFDRKAIHGHEQAAFQEVAFSYPIRTAIDEGWLADIHGYRVDGGADLSNVRTTAGDYNAGDLARKVDAPERTEAALKHWEEVAADRRTIVFCCGVGHAQHAAEAFRERGITAACVHGGMGREERAAVMQAFRTGEMQVLTNCEIATEGFDVPEAACALLLRPTQSWGLYCLDAKTEVLTDFGWIGIQDCIPHGLRAAGFDPATGGIEWSPILGRIERPLKPGESIVSYRNPQTDIRVSDQHRLLVRKRRGQARTKEAWRFETAAIVAETRGTFSMPVSGIQEAPGLPLTDDEIRFIGWVMTDGSINKTTGQIAITQGEHQPWIEEIDRMLIGCGFKFRRTSRERQSRHRSSSPCILWTVSKGKPRGRDKDKRGWEALEPFLDKDLSLSWERADRRQLGVLLEAMHLGDGSKQAGQSWTPRSYHISTGRQKLADRLQSLCVRRGYRCSVAECAWNTNPLYVLHIKDIRERCFGGANAADRPRFAVSLPEPDEKVWCIETAAGTIVTRRNGKVTIMGNCQMVGRVMRLKSQPPHDAIVIDVVDNCNRHSLATVPAILDLPANLDLQGQSLAKAAALLDEMGAKASVLQGALPGSWSELQTLLTRVDLFASIEPPAALEGHCAFSWLAAPGGYRLDCGEGKQARVQEDALGSLELLLTARSASPGGRELLWRQRLGTDLHAAMIEAEQQVTRWWPTCRPLVTRSARWLSDPPTDKQLHWLRQMGVEECVLQTVTKGQARGLLDQLFAQPRKKVMARR